MARRSETSLNEAFLLKVFSHRRLQSVLDLANARSVSAAANTKSKQSNTVTTHLRELEEFFGFKLRDNTGKTTCLSHEGEELALLVHRHLAELYDFRDRHCGNLNSVNLAAGDSLLHLFVLPAIAEIQTDYERTTISVSDQRTFEIIQNLQGFSIDLGLLRQDSIAGQVGHRSLEHEEIGEYRYAVFVPPRLWKGEMTDAEICNLPFAMIKHHWDMDFYKLADGDGVHFGKVQILCENFTQVFRLVRLGRHAGILPIFCKALLKDVICHEPRFLEVEKHKVVLAWNPLLTKVKTKLPGFIERIVQRLRTAFGGGSISSPPKAITSRLRYR